LLSHANGKSAEFLLPNIYYKLAVYIGLLSNDLENDPRSRFSKLRQLWRYRMAGTQRLLAITMAFSLAGIPRSAKPNALGIVVQADHASLRSQAASEGTTVYDGDRLSTAAGGSLRLLMGEAMLYVTEQSNVIVQDTN
jgi:hypothetical protein